MKVVTDSFYYIYDVMLVEKMVGQVQEKRHCVLLLFLRYFYSE